LANTEVANSIAVQADGKILIAGYSNDGSTDDFVITRFNADGTLDTAFGGGDGIVSTPIGAGEDKGWGVTTQLDGKFVVGGHYFNGTNQDFALIRYNEDGTVDSTFGASGIVTTPLGSGVNQALSITIQPDGKLLLGGRGSTGGQTFALVRYNTDGSLDTSFGGGDGIVETPSGAAAGIGNSVTLQANGQILLAGAIYDSRSHFAVLRYDADGTLDSTFGGTGLVTTTVGSTNDSGQSVTVQDDGKVLVAGYSSTGSGNDFALVRYNTNGSLDNTFGTGGVVTTPIGPGQDLAYSVSVAGDGTIVVAGQTHNGTDLDFALVKYNSDGSLNQQFGAIAISLDGNPTYTEGGAAVVLDGDVQVFDQELSGVDDFNGATLTLARNGSASADDQFSATGTLVSLAQGSNNLIVGATTIGSVTQNSGGTLVLTFNSDATNALVNEAMQQIAYSNSNDAPPASVQIDWTFDDGGDSVQTQGGSAEQVTGSTTVNIIDVPNPATLTVPIAQSVDEDAPLTFSTGVGNAIVIDSGSSDDPVVTATLSVTNGTLTLFTTTGITFLDGTSDGDATITISGTESDINTALNGLQYQGTQDYNGADTLTVTTGSDAATDANLHARWEFLNGSLDDETTNNHDGPAVGDPTLTHDAERGDVLTFDGDDRVTITGGTSGLGDTVTIAAWVNLDAAQQDNVFLSIGDDFYVVLDDSNAGRSMSMFANGYTTGSPLATNNIAGEGWNHVAATLDDVNKVVVLYLNGQEIQRGTFSFSDITWGTTGSADISIGARTDGSSAFNGSLDDVRVYDRVLTEP